MDKGLLVIKKLENELKKLEINKLENKMQLESYDIKQVELECKIVDLKAKITKLSDIKNQIEQAPQKRKNEKREIVIALLLAFIGMSIITSLVAGVGIGTFISILKCIGASAFVAALLSVIIIPIEFNEINKKYKTDNLSEIENQLKEKYTQLESVISKQEQINISKNNLEQESSKLQKQLEKVIEKINSIKSLRSKVIEEYCKDNIELAKKLDDAYDFTKNKQKIK